MGCCYSKEQRKIKSTWNESSEGGYLDNINDGYDKSSNPNTSEDSLKIIRKKKKEKDKNNLEESIPSFYIETGLIKNNISHLNPNTINLNNSIDKINNQKRLLDQEEELLPKIKTSLTDNSPFFDSPKNFTKIENKNLEDVECYINVDPKRSLTHYSEFNTNQKKKSGLNSSNKRNSLNKNREENKQNDFNSNFSLSQNSAVQEDSYNQNVEQFAIYDIADLRNEEKDSPTVNFFPEKTFAFIYFEILNFSFSQKDYFKSLYPEMNLVMIIEVNDCALSQEKIFFTKVDEKTYIPILKKEDLQYQDDKKINRYRVIKSLEINDENYPIKISFNFYSFTNMRLLSLGTEDFFFTVNHDNKLNKFHLYQNIYLKYVSKKIGNLGFNFSYKTEEIYANDLLIEMKKNLKIFTNLEKMLLHKEDSSLIFKYYDLYDDIIQNNSSISNSLNKKDKFSSETYFTIEDIKKIDISQELQNTDLTSDRLIDLVDFKQTNEEFYGLFIKIDSIISKAELNMEKINLFKEKVHKKLEDFLTYRFPSDIFIIPLVFSVLRKSFYRAKKESENRRNIFLEDRNDNSSRENNSLSSNGKAKLKSSIILQKSRENLINEKIHYTKSGQLILESFKIIFGYIVKDYSEEILLSALNFIYRFFEEPIFYETDSKHYQTDHYLIECIIKNKLYITLFNLIMKYPEYQACVQPSLDIILRIIKVKKNEVQELIEILTSEKFLKVINMVMLIHGCNMKIMTEIFLIFYQIGERTDLKNHSFLFTFKRLREIFNVFKLNGFDYIHEVIIRLLKHIVLRKINSNPIGERVMISNKNIRRNSTNNINTSIDQSFSNGNNNTLTTSTEDNESIDSVYSLNNEDVAEINLISLNALQFIKTRINLFYELLKYPKQIVNVITNINIILDTLDVVLFKKPKRILITFNFKIFDAMFNLVFLLNETKFISEMERFFSRNDPNLINYKTLVLKMLTGILKLQKCLKEINANSMENSGFKKYNEFIKRLIKEGNYSMNYINGIIEENLSNSNSSLKIDKDEIVRKNVKNLDNMHRELNGFYN